MTQPGRTAASFSIRASVMALLVAVSATREGFLITFLIGLLSQTLDVAATRNAPLDRPSIQPSHGIARTFAVRLLPRLVGATRC